MNDFNSTVIRITLDPDENNGIYEVLVPVPLVNDQINEAVEQNFIVELRLINSINPDGIDLTIRPASACRIIDDDRKLNNLVK